ncbi:MAG: hypothetical protein E6G59_10210 [Actinobacteria bacterium]|nr:MAG: hypothetical protein E6G59_10210 [Actinomycetota bacterium]
MFGMTNKRSAIKLSAAVFAAILVAGVGSAVAGTTPQATHLVPVLLPGLRLARSLGRAPGNQRRTIGVSIATPDPAGEQALYNALYDPSSPLYHRFISPAEYAARFGVAPDTVARATSWLRAGGLRIETVTGSGTYVTASGTIAQLDRLFAITIGRYQIGNVTFIANNRAPSVPVSLPISAVVGLDTVHQFHLPAKTHPAATKSGTAASGFSGVLQPRDLWSLYDMPSSDLGQGQTVGVFGVGESDSTIANLRLFEMREHLRKVPVRLVRTEPGGDAAYGDNSGAIVFASFKKWVDDPQGPRQMNASFGECETNPTNPVTGPLAQMPYGTELGDELEPVGEPILRQATLEGRTLFSSTGDTGSGCPEVVVPVLGAGNGVAIQPVPMVDYPAASKYAVGVGGTVITTDPNKHGVRQSETSWTFTGGGSSFFIQEPSYQKPVENVSMPCLSQPDGTPYAGVVTCRGVPDVATLSGNVLGNGYFIYLDGQPSSEGGTSLSSPLMMGIWARIQAASTAARGVGFANPTIYRLGTTHYAKDFYDVTSGETPLANGVYQPGPGWDYTSGFGVPDVAHWLDDIDHRRAAVHAAPAQEKPAADVCVATMTSPAGNASNPIDGQLGNLSTLDITRATLSQSADRKSVIATLSGPGLDTTPALGGTSGVNYFVLWSYKGHEWFANAAVDSVGQVTYWSGNTDSGQYTTYANGHATGTFANHVIRIVVPLSEVGKPPAGARLMYPMAVAQLNVGAPGAGPIPAAVYLALTADSASAPSKAGASRGQAVLLGACHTATSAARIASSSAPAVPAVAPVAPAAAARADVVAAVVRVRAPRELTEEVAAGCIALVAAALWVAARRRRARQI